MGRARTLPGEDRLVGRGVSYCATCDGFFFRGKNVVVLGGGSTALMEALFLKQLGCKDVTVVHRRDQLRAEKIYQKEAADHGIHVLLNQIADRISGTEMVDAVHLTDAMTGKKTTLSVDGVFVSVGDTPQNQLAKQLGVAVDEQGYIVVDRQQKTNVPGVFAAGDITGGVRQVVTAVAEGAVAALSSAESCGKSYPY
jgi:thioredoxin reductase (NADPH)